MLTLSRGAEAQSNFDADNLSVAVYAGLLGVYHSDKSNGAEDIGTIILGAEARHEMSSALSVSVSLMLIGQDSFGCPSAATLAEFQASVSDNVGLFGRWGASLKCDGVQQNYWIGPWAETGIRYITPSWSLDLAVVPIERPIVTLGVRRKFNVW